MIFCAFMLVAVVSSASADSINNLINKAKVSRTIAYTPQNICLSLIKAFVLKEDGIALPELINKHGANCGDLYRSGEYRDKDWIIQSNWSPRKPDEITATIAGPAAKVSRFAPMGYEFYAFQIIMFFDTDLKLQPYIYYRTSRYNLRDLGELVDRENRDNELMDPYEQWSDNFLPVLNSAISEVVDYRISEARQPN